MTKAADAIPSDEMSCMGDIAPRLPRIAERPSRAVT